MAEAMTYLEEEAPIDFFFLTNALFGIAMSLLLPYSNFCFYVFESVNLFLKKMLTSQKLIKSFKMSMEI